MVSTQAAHFEARTGRHAVQWWAWGAGLLASASNNADCQGRHAHSLNVECVCQFGGNEAASHPDQGVQCSTPGYLSKKLTKPRMTA